MRELNVALAVVLMLALSLGVLSCSNGGNGGSGEDGELDFRIENYSAIDDNGSAALLVTFVSSSGVHLTFLDARGIKLLAVPNSFPSGQSSAKVKLGRAFEAPVGGDYQVRVRRSALGETVTTRTLTFNGPELVITDVDLGWDIWPPDYQLTDIGFEVRNNGDMPAYVRSCEVFIGSKRASYGGFGEAVPPGEVKSLYTSAIGIPKILDQEHDANLELRDVNNAIMCSHSFIAKPEPPETVFEYIDAELTEHLGAAALRLRFALHGDLIYMYLKDPRGQQREPTIKVLRGTTEKMLKLAERRETPPSGRYTLFVEDAAHQVFYQRHFDFDGPVIDVGNVRLSWEYETISQSYLLKRVSLDVRNSGDLPAYIQDIVISIDSQTATIPVWNQGDAWPGSTNTIARDVIQIDIEPGAKRLILELRDFVGTSVGSYSASVTPS
jgi:hypothetical protein